MYPDEFLTPHGIKKADAGRGKTDEPCAGEVQHRVGGVGKQETGFREERQGLFHEITVPQPVSSQTRTSGRSVRTRSILSLWSWR